MRRISLLVAVALAGCQQQSTDPAPEESATAAAVPMATPLAASAPAPIPATITAPTPSASRDPANVLIHWATAITLRDWATVRAYWGENGGESAMTPAEFGANWDGLKTPKVSIGDGQQEGAAGSLFYTAPVTITDGARVIKGDVVLRRVNDVDGATGEQLRWHIESSTLAP